jgi:hypothetical protein
MVAITRAIEPEVQATMCRPKSEPAPMPLLPDKSPESFLTYERGETRNKSAAFVGVSGRSGPAFGHSSGLGMIDQVARLTIERRAVDEIDVIVGVSSRALLRWGVWRTTRLVRRRAAPGGASRQRATRPLSRGQKCFRT